jgi:four helix bundle protein
MSYNDFIEMPVWQLAFEIVEDVYQLTERLAKREDYALCGQMRKAAISIAANIAEGFGRNHTKDKLNFYHFSRGSSSEEISHLLCGYKVGYFTLKEIDPIKDKCKQVIEELNKMVKSLTLKISSQP